MWGITTNRDTRNTWLITWGDEGDGRDDPHRLLPRGDLAKMLRFARTIVPKQRVLSVVLEQNRPWWGHLVRELPPENLLEQPLDRGSAPGILAAVLRIVARDPDAIVVLLCTHAATPARDEVYAAIDEARHEDRVLETDTVTVGRARALLEVFRAACPDMVAEMAKPEVVEAPETLDLIFPFLPDTDFASAVLAPAPPRLLVRAH